MFASSRRAWRIRPLFLLLLVCGLAPLLWRQETQTNQLALPAHFPFSPEQRIATYRETSLPTVSGSPSVHAASAVALEGGQLLAVWFAGSREGAADVAIWSSRFDGVSWSTPQKLADRQSTMQQTQRYVRKVGNPVLYSSSDGALHLVYVSVSLGGWAGSALNHRISYDQGKTWQPAQRLISSPFFNISTLARAQPLALQDGRVLLPAYHEFVNKYPQFLLLDKGTVQGSSAILRAVDTLQPAPLALNGQHAMAWLRSSGETRKVQFVSSRDGGKKWSPPQATNVDNPNAAVASVRLDDGKILLLANPSTGGRYHLAAFLSDNGEQFEFVRSLAGSSTPSGDEFSYPYLLQHNGVIDLLYTWQRKEIRHVRFNRAWLQAGKETLP